MSIPPDIAQEQRVKTREAAAAFVEDISHMRRLMASEFPERGDIRRLSAVLRRLLIDDNGDLRKIAPCRIGRVELLAEDTKRYVKSDPAFYFNCRGVIIASWPGNPRDWPTWSQAGDAKQPDKINLSIDGFVGQSILCFNRLWIKRGSLIKHIANKGSGVHSPSQVIQTPEDLAIEQARRALVRKLVNGNHSILLNQAMFGHQFKQEKYDTESLDPVHLALVGTADLMLASPSLLELERTILTEIG